MDKEREETEKERQDVWEKSNHLEQMQRQVRDDAEKKFEGTIEVMRKEVSNVMRATFELTTWNRYCIICVHYMYIVDVIL